MQPPRRGGPGAGSPGEARPVEPAHRPRRRRRRLRARRAARGAAAPARGAGPLRRRGVRTAGESAPRCSPVLSGFGRGRAGDGGRGREGGGPRQRLCEPPPGNYRGFPRPQRPRCGAQPELQRGRGEPRASPAALGARRLPVLSQPRRGQPRPLRCRPRDPRGWAGAALGAVRGAECRGRTPPTPPVGSSRAASRPRGFPIARLLRTGLPLPGSPIPAHLDPFQPFPAPGSTLGLLLAALGGRFPVRECGAGGAGALRLL